MQKRKCNILRFAAVGIALCLCIFIACENGAGDSGNTGNETGNTKIKFTNLEQYPVTVYRDSLRQNEFAKVAALGSTVVAAESSASGTAFYPTFHLELFDIPGISVPYNAPGIVTPPIAKDSTTDVPIPKLETIDTGTAFIKVINNSSSSLTLRQGGTEINLLGASYGIVAPNQSAVYEVVPGPSSGYSLMRNTVTPVTFPAGFTEFSRGVIYVFDYNGTSLTLTEIKSVPGTRIIVPGSGLAAKLAWLQAYAENNSSYTVEINSDENIGPQTLGYSGKSGVTIAISGIEGMCTINLSAQGVLFTISSGTTLILDNNITLNGRSGNNGSLVSIDDGTMIMNEGTKIAGNSNSLSSLSFGGGVSVKGRYVNGESVRGTFTMNGGTISGNSSHYGGGVYVNSDGTFIMNGGTISGNTAFYSNSNPNSFPNGGGGVYVQDYGIFTMKGGAISGNIATPSSGGGGVYAIGYFRMSGGVIYGSNVGTELRNTAYNGATLTAGGAWSFQYQYGTFSGDTFYPSGNLTTTDTTIRIVNGNLLTE